MPAYVISARNIVNWRFGDEPGTSQFLEVPDFDTVLKPTQAIPRADWVRKIQALASPRQTRGPTGVARSDILLFIHGYNNSLETVLVRHRLLQSSLATAGFRGLVVSFDWPSGDIALGYLEDRADAKRTALQLVTDCIVLFARLTQENCPINVHLLAHSTGAYVIREAFDDADDRRAPASVNWTVSQIALIGADLSAASMAEGDSSTASLYRHCIRLTNYSNPYDEALQIANVKRLGVAPRVGRVGLPDTAPAKAVEVNCGLYWKAHIAKRPASDFVGYPSHSWHFGDPVFTRDLAETLKGDLDRAVIPTRISVAGGKLVLVAPDPGSGMVVAIASGPG
jgi:hypothetical protein